MYYLIKDMYYCVFFICLILYLCICQCSYVIIKQLCGSSIGVPHDQHHHSWLEASAG